MTRFRLTVHKMKCTYCDLLFLVEDNLHGKSPKFLTCPDCRGEDVHQVVYMGEITIVEEDSE